MVLSLIRQQLPGVCDGVLSRTSFRTSRLQGPDAYIIFRHTYNGGPSRIRTDNPLNANQMLSQLELWAHMVGDVESRLTTSLPPTGVFLPHKLLAQFILILTARTIVLLIACAQRPGHNFISFPAILKLVKGFIYIAGFTQKAGPIKEWVIFQIVDIPEKNYLNIWAGFTPEHRCYSRANHGGRNSRTRTYDFWSPRPAFYQLNYISINKPS